MKRLRKYVKKIQIKYYVCGEYGDCIERLYYYVIVFNLFKLFNKYVEKVWKYGYIYIGTVIEVSIMYIIKYMLKGLKCRRLEEVDELGR